MRAHLFLVLTLLAAACPSDPSPPADAGMDAAPSDEDAAIDEGPADPECNADAGIECDGDWTTQCTPRCDADECCSPQNGSFECVPREEDGFCPAADIWMDPEHIDDGMSVAWEYFPDDSCALVEGCVGGSGWRRILRFATWTPNTGAADMFLGVPSGDSPHFQYSSCHAHFHFLSYAQYELRASDGSVTAVGHKQAFCLMDTGPYPDGGGIGVYTCDNQGIQRGWQDAYDTGLDCQWIDVTDVAAGEYTLHVELNTEHVLLESNYDNNVVDAPVTVPEDIPPDVTAPCDEEDLSTGETRDCGWEIEGTHSCTPSAAVAVACSSVCGLGTCTGDPVLRVCESDHQTDCNAHHVLAQNDESQCNEIDSCSKLEFICPSSGSYVVLRAAYSAGESFTCVVDAQE